MNNEQELKELVREKYGEIAGQSRQQNLSSCCGAGASCQDVASIMADDYQLVEGYVPEADLGLGCGLPTAFARIKEGDTVIDLGSGAGNDLFVARKMTGSQGRLIGVDFTPAMIERARENARRLGYENMEFVYADIDQLPLESGIADAVLSNCVLNLVPDKKKVFAQIFRVLKPGAHFSISDIVKDGHLPDYLRKAAEMYAGCISGAIPQADYLAIIRECGFVNIKIEKDKPIIIPEDILQPYLPGEGKEMPDQSAFGIHSITVYAEKPIENKGCCCGSC